MAKEGTKVPVGTCRTSQQRNGKLEVATSVFKSSVLEIYLCFTPQVHKVQVQVQVGQVQVQVSQHLAIQWTTIGT